MTELDDEIEAFMSVYPDSIVLGPAPGFQNRLLFFALPRGSVDNSSSFVEAQLEIDIPDEYPCVPPKVEVLRTCGLNDEGKTLLAETNRFLHDNHSEDMMLFILADFIADHLDSVNDGECMICWQPLVSDAENGMALKTPCYHCFHVNCLCHWAALYLKREYDKKKAAEQPQEQLRLRSFQGEVKSCESQLRTLEQEMSLILQQKEAFQRELDSSIESGESGSGGDMDLLQQELHGLNQALAKSASSKKKQRILSQIHAVQGRIQRAQEEGPVDGTRKVPQIENEIQRLDEAAKNCEGKRLRLAEKLDDAKRAVSEEEQHAMKKDGGQWMEDIFPCPCCRSALGNCLPHSPDIFRRCLQAAVERCTQADDENEEVMHCGSVQLMSPELQELAKEIQRKQAEMRRCLSGHHSWKSAGVRRCDTSDNAEELSTSEAAASMKEKQSMARRKSSPSVKSSNPASSSAPARRVKRLQDRKYCGHSQRHTRHTYDDPESGADADLQEAIRLSLLHSVGEERNVDVVKQEKQPHSAAASECRNEACVPVDESTSHDSDNGRADMCVLCDDSFDSSDVLFAVGHCNHACVCGVCALRSRLLLKNFNCPVCRQHLDIIICTNNLSTSFSEMLDKKKCAGSKLVLHSAGQLYAPKAYMNRVLNRLQEFRCKACGRVFGPTDSLRTISRHLFKEHALYICEICVGATNCFPSEMAVYTEEQLADHNRSGDSSTGTRGHPRCHLCSKLFFDEDALNSHQTDVHHVCFVCQAMGDSNSMLYNSANDLHNHFKQAHHVCKVCKKLRVVSVFSSAASLEDHMQRTHPVTNNMISRYR